MRQPPSVGPKDGRDDHAECEDRDAMPRSPAESSRAGWPVTAAEGAATGALNSARQQDHSQAGGSAAGEGRDREDDDAGDQEALAPEFLREPRLTGRTMALATR